MKKTILEDENLKHENGPLALGATTHLSHTTDLWHVHTFLNGEPVIVGNNQTLKALAMGSVLLKQH